jgi:hypothetical protein
VYLNSKLRKILNGGNFNTEVIELASLKLNNKCRETLNCELLNGSSTVKIAYVMHLFC